ncbi:MAG: hypothetical protein C4K60_13135 [Ideonella sp. MAG2]|nr:MAG: hypothetical protein C4K60_13135 [Ideonella sp. MAG2]
MTCFFLNVACRRIIWQVTGSLLLWIGLSPGGIHAAMAATCHCSVTCQSSTGASLTQDWNEQDRAQFPPGPQAGKCKNDCQHTMDKMTAQWALEGKLCKTGQCSGTSKLGTLSAWALTPAAFDNSQQAFCSGGDGSTGATCCPLFATSLSRDQLASMFTIGAHNPGSPYTYSFNSNINTTNLAAYLGQWAQWLRFDGCPAVAGFRITVNVYETNVDAAAPASPDPTLPDGALLATQSVSMTPSVNPATFTMNMASSPNWRRTRVSMVPVDANGRPVQCSKVGPCDNTWTYAWRPTAVAARIANPAASAAQIQRAPTDMRLKESAVQAPVNGRPDIAP